MPRRSDMPFPLAHSAPSETATADMYVRHVKATTAGTLARATAMLKFATKPPMGLLGSLEAAATFHDLGKLDTDTQSALRMGRASKLKWDHIDAGVAHLSAPAIQSWTAAWLIRAHHSPGLPENADHFDKDRIGRRLRGRRGAQRDDQRHDEQITRTNEYLGQYVSDHEAAVGSVVIQRGPPAHGLPMRLALSCLVDADHTDTAFYDTGRLPPEPPEARWAERLDALCSYVRGLTTGESEAERQRNLRRSAFFEACLQSKITNPMTACEGPVGLGKTTAVTAYLLRRARDESPNLRRLVIVAPYTNILTQTAATLRKALVLPGERPDQVVVEHHHRADFSSRADRDVAVLWQAPIVLTTAVSFFETLSACDPGSLRKLHSLPGSAVFIDEAHAALPTKLWPQNWLWLQELAEGWGCRFVFASGSLSRFWQNAEIIRQPVQLPELLPKNQAIEVLTAERQRVRYRLLEPKRSITVEELIGFVRKAPGPRLVILNTIQNAAVVARAMRKSGMRALHLSTALCPGDRECILKRIERRLSAGWKNWTLVATSCVEAGVDLSFRTAFRERFATSSIIQVGGRVNRHGEYDSSGGGVVYDFALDGIGITQHPAAAISSEILLKLMIADALNGGDPAEVVTRAMEEELRQLPLMDHKLLIDAEAQRNYPAVKELGRVIEADTRLVVVDPRLRKRLAEHRPTAFRDLLRGSVQLWATKIDKLGLDKLPGRTEIFAWRKAYDPDFLGIMAGVFQADEFSAAGGAVI